MKRTFADVYYIVLLTTASAVITTTQQHSLKINDLQSLCHVARTNSALSTLKYQNSKSWYFVQWKNTLGYWGMMINSVYGKRWLPISWLHSSTAAKQLVVLTRTWWGTELGWCWLESRWWWRVCHWCCPADCRSWFGLRKPGGSRWFSYLACRWWNQSAVRTEEIIIKETIQGEVGEILCWWA